MFATILIIGSLYKNTFHVPTGTAPGINLSWEHTITLWVFFRYQLDNGVLESQSRSAEQKQGYFLPPKGTLIGQSSQFLLVQPHLNLAGRLDLLRHSRAHAPLTMIPRRRLQVYHNGGRTSARKTTWGWGLQVPYVEMQHICGKHFRGKWLVWISLGCLVNPGIYTQLSTYTFLISQNSLGELTTPEIWTWQKADFLALHQFLSSFWSLPDLFPNPCRWLILHIEVRLNFMTQISNGSLLPVFKVQIPAPFWSPILQIESPHVAMKQGMVEAGYLPSPHSFWGELCSLLCGCLGVLPPREGYNTLPSPSTVTGLRLRTWSN